MSVIIIMAFKWFCFLTRYQFVCVEGPQKKSAQSNLTFIYGPGHDSQLCFFSASENNIFYKTADQQI